MLPGVLRGVLNSLYSCQGGFCDVCSSSIISPTQGIEPTPWPHQQPLAAAAGN